MTKHTINEPKEFSTNLDEIPFGAPGLPETFNPSFSKLINNDAYLLERLNNLNTNDKQAREEILNIKRQLAEKEVIDFIDKSSGIGYFDTLTDTEGVDLTNTSATVDTVKGEVNFKSQGNHNLTVVEDSSTNKIKTLEQPVVGDYVKDTHEILSVLETTIEGESRDVNVDNATIMSSSSYLFVQGANPKVVRLSNGWLVCAIVVRVSSQNYTHNLYITKTGDWSDSKLIATAGGVNNETMGAITSHGTVVYYTWIAGSPESGSVFYTAFDALTFVGPTIPITNTKISGFTLVNSGFLSIACDNSTVHIVHSAKYTSLPNNYNLKYVKGVISDNNKTIAIWESPQQITNDNTASSVDSNRHPYIIVMNGVPSIVSTYQGSTSQGIMLYKRDNSLGSNPHNSSWTRRSIYTISGASLNQIYPSMCYIPPEINGQPKGELHVIWQSRQTGEHSNYNIWLMSSLDLGVTLIGGASLFGSSTTISNQVPSISYDVNGSVYVTCARRTVINGVWSIVYKKLANNTWSDITDLVSVGGVSFPNASQLQDPTIKRDNPIVMYLEDTTTQRVKFKGSWVEGSPPIISYESTLDSPLNVTKDEVLPVISKSGDILKMLPQTFPNYKDINLKLYYDKVNSLTVSEDNGGGNEIKVFNATRPIEVGDNIFYQGVENKVLNVEGDLYSELNDVKVMDGPLLGSHNSPDNMAVRLDDGTIFVVVRKNTPHRWEVVKSVDNGTTWTTEFTNQADSTVSISINSNGMVLVLSELYTSGGVHYVRNWFFDVDNMQSPMYIDQWTATNHTNGSNSIAISADGTKACICASNRYTSHPNSFNIAIREYDITSTTLKPLTPYTQLTTSNTLNVGYFYSTVHYVGDYIAITAMMRNTSAYSIVSLSNDPSFVSSDTMLNLSANWKGKFIKPMESYQAISCYSTYILPTVSGGELWVTWVSMDSLSIATYNVYVSSSKDGGMSWTKTAKLSNSTDNAKDERYSAIGYNYQGDVTVYWGGFIEGQTNPTVKKRSLVDGAWGDTELLASNSNAFVTAYIIGGSVKGVISPLVVGDTYGSTRLSLFGSLLKVTAFISVENPMVVFEGQQLMLSDFHVYNHGVDMNLKGINPDNYEFELNNVNSNKTDLRIFGKDNKINSLAYAIS